MYNAYIMIRTQVYLEEQTHKDLVQLAEREKKSMAEVTRHILNEGKKKEKLLICRV
jgi:predicted DNA-binding ribbon-helix-helix protein